MRIFLGNSDIFKDEDYALDICIVGQEHCHPHKGRVDKVRENYSLHFVQFGKGVIRTRDGVSRELSKGSAFMLYEGEYYDYYPDKKDPWSYFWVEFSGQNFDKLLNYCGFDRKTFWKYPKNFNFYIDAMKQALECFDASETQKLKCSAWLMIILGEFISAESASKDLQRLSVKKRLIRSLLIYMNNNFSLDLNAEMIARENGISVRSLNSIFAEMVGMPPIQYLNTYRIAIACEKLQTSDANIAEVATWSGFSDQLYFSRVFKKIKGVSPRDYKKTYGGEDPFLWIREKGLLYR